MLTSLYNITTTTSNTSFSPSTHNHHWFVSMPTTCLEWQITQYNVIEQVQTVQFILLLVIYPKWNLLLYDILSKIQFLCINCSRLGILYKNLCFFILWYPVMFGNFFNSYGYFRHDTRYRRRQAKNKQPNQKSIRLEASAKQPDTRVKLVDRRR